MLDNHKQFLAWRRQVFLRNPHRDLNAIYSGLRGASGIYLIGCADEIVYVGKSFDLTERPIDSLGRNYHRVPDVSLPWYLALAPCHWEEMHERESTAIRAFAPRFNTSIPSIPQSKGRMPEITGHAAVFQDQLILGGAFHPINMQRQMEIASLNPAPPWRQGKQRKKTGKREPKPVPHAIAPSVQLTGDQLLEVWRRYSVSLLTSLKFPINLCDDGSVVTRDGVFIGRWSMDQYEFASFTPDGSMMHLMEAPTVGLLCMNIRTWYEEETGERL
jgi:hypothetical protein